MTRKNWHEYFINIAHEVASRATCEKLKVGAVITNNKRIVSQGYNGAPKGFNHCTEASCNENEYGHCERSVHAEINAIIHANRSDLDGANLYLTHAPCTRCQKVILNTGIESVFYDESYKTDLKWLEESDVSYQQICMED